MTIWLAVLIQYQRVTDGRTDGQTSSLYLLHASAYLTHVKTNDPKVFKVGIRNDLGIYSNCYAFGVKRSKVKVTGSVPY